MITGIYFLLFAATIFAAPLTIARARQHDRRLQPAEDIDLDALSEEADTRFEDDADSYRKGER
ncbi:hypothetical protein [Arthrobacter sp. EpRS71]|uniref:hypothetical protein n=1 Tax=Arthrobacter sp. EpRS71 TaxID=1743141 RepID=UPI0007477FC7|nr:hypothetical protein [Arthrobacter sp. EpRS71]KUM34578.1 hypothetical protein AR689_10580 [Arthrobacter sp. EpRS71]